MRKPIFLLAFLIVIVIGLFMIRMVISNTISTSGVALGKTQDEITKFRTENMLLREKIFTFSSLTNIASEAGRIGLVEGKSSLALSKTRPIAALR